MKVAKNKRTAGFTLVEIAIAIALFIVVVIKLSMAMTAATKAHRQQTAETALDDQARRVLDQVAYAVMGASRESLVPDPESPLYSSELRYEVSLGVEDGETVWSDPEAILLQGGNQQIVWTQNPGEADERRVVWTNIARPFLEGELPNGIDDNGNGVVDETGLSFVLDRDSILIRLSLEKIDQNGQAMTRTVETVVTCRN